MRILIACEFSGIVRDAFIEKGHDAISCDLEDTENPGPHHIGDVLEIINNGWDLIIAHPPCTYLANSGVRWLKDNPERYQLRIDAVDFVKKIWQADCEKIVIENPIGHLSTAWQKPNQIIQPFEHGHAEWKSTCLWIKGLPNLLPSHYVIPDKTVGGGKKPGRISSRLHRLSPSKDRQKARSKTFQGIAKAMSEQWG